MRIKIHVDGGPRLGLGHLSRMKAVAGELSGMGATVSIRGESSYASRFLGAEIQDFHTPDVVVIDLPYSGDHLVEKYQSAAIPSVVLDHCGTTVPDITISVDSELARQKGNRHFSGLRYAIIRKSLREQVAQLGREAVVSIGGSDLLGQSSVAAERLLDFGVPVLVVKGSAATPTPKGVDSRVKYLENPSNFDTLLAAGSFVVTNGGTTLLEALHLGKCIFVVPQTTEEESFSNRMLGDGLVAGVGIESLRKPSKKEVAEARLSGPDAVDGLGVLRVARIILGAGENRE